MSKDVSVAFKASDNLTKQIQEMRKGVNNLTKDITSYRKVQDEAFNKKVEVKFEIEQAKRELKELGKAVKDNVSGSEQAFKDKQKSVELLSEEYRRLTRVAKEASKAENKLQEDISRTSNRNASRGGISSSGSSVLESLGKAGLGGMIGDSVMNLAGHTISASFGKDFGDAFNSVAGGAVSGAAIGSVIPGIGTAVGALAGAGAGAINAITDYKEKKDDIYRDEVKTIYNEIMEEQKRTLESGKTVASDMETNRRALSVLTGSKENGDKLFQDIWQFGVDTPYESGSMLNSAKQMMAYGIKQEDIIKSMKMLGEASMGDQAKFDSMSYAYAQIQSAGKLRGQDLLQLTSAGFNPLKVLAEEAGVSLEKMNEKMSDGLVSAQDVTRAFQIATSEGGMFFGAMDELMNSFSGQASVMEDMKNMQDKAMGEGYNEERKKGLEEEIATLDSGLQERIEEVNRAFGKHKAEIENRYQETRLQLIEEAMNSEQYIAAQQADDAVTMYSMIAKAEGDAKDKYRQDEGVIQELESQKQLVQSVQEGLRDAETYLNFGMEMGNQFSLGFRRKANLGLIATGKGLVGGSFSEKYDEKTGLPLYGPGFATGLDRVPYNNMPALLHEGERVLTKVEADKQDKGASVTPQISITVHNESGNAYEITREICNQIIKASENFAGVY